MAESRVYYGAIQNYVVQIVHQLICLHLWLRIQVPAASGGDKSLHHCCHKEKKQYCFCYRIWQLIHFCLKMKSQGSTLAAAETPSDNNKLQIRQRNEPHMNVRLQG